MPAAEFLKQLFEYNHHSNQHLIDVFDKHNFSPEKLIQLFSHVLNAHHIWNTRILLQPAEYTVWQLHRIEMFTAIITANYDIESGILIPNPLQRSTSSS